MLIQPHDPGLAPGARENGSSPAAEAATITRDYRLLRIRGLSPVEAGNVVAYLRGLHAAESGWSVEEIKHLVAVRSLVARGAINS
jgi:hypothetical protein